MPNKRLFLFDMDGTLIRSFMREGYRDRYDEVEVLPGRLAVIRALRMIEGVHFGIVTNQAGVAFGYQTTNQVFNKLDLVCRTVFEGSQGASVSGAGFCWRTDAVVAKVCFTHPNAKRHAFKTSGLGARKPSGDMIREAMIDFAIPPAQTLYIGDMEPDEQAARAAGVDFRWAHDFFDRLDERPNCLEWLDHPDHPKPCELRAGHEGRHRAGHQCW